MELTLPIDLRRRFVRDQALEACPPGFTWNPSAWKQRVPIAILGFIAAAISTYLALFQWGLLSSVWDPFFGSQTIEVIDSSTSHFMYSWIGIPDAALGALAYLGDAIFGIAGSTRRWQYRPWLVILFGIDVIPLGIVSAVLVFIQGFIIGSWCTLCLVTAIISLILVVMAYDEVWASLRYLMFVYRKHRSLFWDVVWGKRPSPDLESEYLAEGGK